MNDSSKTFVKALREKIQERLEEAREDIETDTAGYEVIEHKWDDLTAENQQLVLTLTQRLRIAKVS